MNELDLHNIVWKRYIRMPYGHLLDSAEVDGTAVIPTAEECRNYIPSILAWTTPIADGAMFGGLYLYALLKKYEIEPSDALKEQLHTLVDGLLLLCDISDVDGFIARGVADDGKTHYPCSANDQTGPWILGLYKATKSTAFNDNEKKEIEKRLSRTLKGFIANDWHFKNEWEGTALGSFKTGDYRNCAKFLFAAAVARELGIIPNEEFLKYANEKPLGFVTSDKFVSNDSEIPESGLFSRREILAQGFSHDMTRASWLIQFWITVCAHLSVLELKELDQDGKDFYERGLYLNAVTANNFVREFDLYNPNEFPEFDHDWRKIVPKLNKYTAYEDILKEGQRANALYAEICPLRLHERQTLGQALFSAWIAVTGNDKKIADSAYKNLIQCVEQVDWDKVGQCYAFVAESAIISYNYLWRK